MNRMQELNITPDENGEMYHICDSGITDGGDHWEYSVVLTRYAASESWDAYDALLESDLIEDDEDNAPDDVYAYRVEDEHEVEWHADYDKAVAAFTSMVDLFYDAKADGLL